MCQFLLDRLRQERPHYCDRREEPERGQEKGDEGRGKELGQIRSLEKK